MKYAHHIIKKKLILNKCFKKQMIRNVFKLQGKGFLQFQINYLKIILIKVQSHFNHHLSLQFVIHYHKTTILI